MIAQPPGLWSWDTCKGKVTSLKGRLGFPDKEELGFLKLTIDLRDGAVMDDLTGRQLKSVDTWSRHMVQTVYYVLSGYSEAEHVKPSGRLISSKQFRGARFGDLDNRRVRNRIIERFREDPEALVACVEKLGGGSVEFPYGDVAVRMGALPLVPVTIVYNSETEEFDADVRVFYDVSVQEFLDTERINFLTNLTVSRMATAFK